MPWELRALPYYASATEAAAGLLGFEESILKSVEEGAGTEYGPAEVISKLWKVEGLRMMQGFLKDEPKAALSSLNKHLDLDFAWMEITSTMKDGNRLAIMLLAMMRDIAVLAEKPALGSKLETYEQTMAMLKQQSEALTAEGERGLGLSDFRFQRSLMVTKEVKTEEQIALDFHFGMANLLVEARISEDPSISIGTMSPQSAQSYMIRPLLEQLQRAVRRNKFAEAQEVYFRLRTTYLTTFMMGIRSISLDKLIKQEGEILAKEPGLKGCFEYMRSLREGDSGEVVWVGPGLPQGVLQANEQLARLKIIKASSAAKMKENVIDLQDSLVKRGLLFGKYLDQQERLDEILKARFGTGNRLRAPSSGWTKPS